MCLWLFLVNKNKIEMEAIHEMLTEMKDLMNKSMLSILNSL